MEVSYIIEPVIGSGYRVIGAGGLSVGLTAEGATPGEAIDRLAKRIRLRVDAGARLAAMIVGSDDAPWKQDAGYLKDDPIYDSWREAMDE